MLNKNTKDKIADLIYDPEFAALPESYVWRQLDAILYPEKREPLVIFHNALVVKKKTKKKNGKKLKSSNFYLLKDALDEKGLTQSALAARIGVTEIKLSQFVTGKTLLNDSLLALVSKELKISVAVLKRKFAWVKKSK